MSAAVARRVAVSSVASGRARQPMRVTRLVLPSGAPGLATGLEAATTASSNVVGNSSTSWSRGLQPQHQHELKYPAVPNLDLIARPGELNERVWSAIRERLEGDHEDEAFMVVDVHDVEAKVAAWRALLPRVEPFYAVKCHDDDVILRRMVELGVGFDCASRNEMDKVFAAGAAADEIIFAHPCKPRRHLEHAVDVGVNMMTFDNYDELLKIAELHPNAEVLLRLLPDDSSAVCQLGVKYGAGLDTVPGLLSAAKDLGVNLVGVSYHVGSGCQDPAAFSDAAHLARSVFDMAADRGLHLSLLDIGGGFPGDAVSSWGASLGNEGTENGGGPDSREMMFPAIARQLRTTLDVLFPVHSGVRIIAEPGRYMMHSSCTLVSHIMARRRVPAAMLPSADDAGGAPLSDRVTDASREAIRYYINEGVYGSFNCIIYDHAEVEAFPLRVRPVDASTEPYPVHGVPEELVAPHELVEASVWGPTCDGLDCVLKSVELPMLDVNDWLYFPNMGAYTISAAAPFNGFDVATKLYV